MLLPLVKLVAVLVLVSVTYMVVDVASPCAGKVKLKGFTARLEVVPEPVNMTA